MKAPSNYYLIPKVLFYSKEYRNISGSAKLLYGIAMDRYKTAEMEGQRDTKGRVYIQYSLKDAASDLNCSVRSVQKYFYELQQHGLILERDRQPAGETAVIYLNPEV